MVVLICQGNMVGFLVDGHIIYKIMVSILFILLHSYYYLICQHHQKIIKVDIDSYIYCSKKWHRIVWRHILEGYTRQILEKRTTSEESRCPKVSSLRRFDCSWKVSMEKYWQISLFLPNEIWAFHNKHCVKLSFQVFSIR